MKLQPLTVRVKALCMVKPYADMEDSYYAVNLSALLSRRPYWPINAVDWLRVENQGKILRTVLAPSAPSSESQSGQLATISERVTGWQGYEGGPYYYFCKNRIYFFMRDTQREAETQAEGEAGSMQGA